MLVCVETQWALMKMRVRVVASGTPWTCLLSENNCHLDHLSTSYRNDLLSKRFHEDAENASVAMEPICFPVGNSIKGLIGMWGREHNRAYIFTKHTKPWAGHQKSDAVYLCALTCCWCCMTSYVTETWCRGEIKREIKQVWWILLLLCFQDFSIIVFIDGSCRIVVINCFV